MKVDSRFIIKSKENPLTLQAFGNQKKKKNTFITVDL